MEWILRLYKQMQRALKEHTNINETSMLKFAQLFHYVLCVPCLRIRHSLQSFCHICTEIFSGRRYVQTVGFLRPMRFDVRMDSIEVSVWQTFLGSFDERDSDAPDSKRSWPRCAELALFKRRHLSRRFHPRNSLSRHSILVITCLKQKCLLFCRCENRFLWMWTGFFCKVMVQLIHDIPWNITADFSTEVSRLKDPFILPWQNWKANSRKNRILDSLCTRNDTV